MSKSPQAFRTIREVAEWLGVAAHVLRFWESKFAQIKPVKRAGGRRYYRPADMALVGGIKVLLHDQGLTIRGVQKMIREEGIAHIASLAPPFEEAATEALNGAAVEQQPTQGELLETEAPAAEDVAEPAPSDTSADPAPTDTSPADADAAAADTGEMEPAADSPAPVTDGDALDHLRDLVSRLPALSEDRRKALIPLVARLEVLRDRLATPRS